MSVRVRARTNLHDTDRQKRDTVLCTTFLMPKCHGFQEFFLHGGACVLLNKDWVSFFKVTSQNFYKKIRDIRFKFTTFKRDR